MGGMTRIRPVAWAKIMATSAAMRMLFQPPWSGSKTTYLRSSNGASLPGTGSERVCEWRGRGVRGVENGRVRVRCGEGG